MPRSPYAASKAGGDRLAYAYFATYGLPVVVTRCSNNYGPRQYPEKLVPLFVTNAIDDEPLPVYGTGRNTPRLAARRRPLRRAVHAAGVGQASRARRSTSAREHELDVLTITDTHPAACSNKPASADPSRRGPAGSRPPIRRRLDQAHARSPAGSPRVAVRGGHPATPSSGTARNESWWRTDQGRRVPRSTTSACTASARSLREVKA